MEKNATQTKQPLQTPKPKKGATIAATIFSVLSVAVFCATFIFFYPLQSGEGLTNLVFAILIPIKLILYVAAFICSIISLILSIKSLKNSQNFKRRKNFSAFLLIFSIILAAGILIVLLLQLVIIN